jgi:hypothetical protein
MFRKKFESTDQHTRPFTFLKQEYPPAHWANVYPSTNDPQFITILKVKGFSYALFINPTDARGYRAIALLVPNEDRPMSDVHNKEDHSIDAKIGLSIATTILMEVYLKFGLVPQQSMAGNNSLSMAPDGSIQFGQKAEPSLLHAHTFGRGNPEQVYAFLEQGEEELAYSLPLRGPQIPHEFLMKGMKSHVDVGNQEKIKWPEDNHDLSFLATCFAAKIPEIVKTIKSEVVEIVSIKTIPVREKKEQVETKPNVGHKI